MHGYVWRVRRGNGGNRCGRTVGRNRGGPRTATVGTVRGDGRAVRGDRGCPCAVTRSRGRAVAGPLRGRCGAVGAQSSAERRRGAVRRHRSPRSAFIREIKALKRADKSPRALRGRRWGSGERSVTAQRTGMSGTERGAAASAPTAAGTRGGAQPQNRKKPFFIPLCFFPRSGAHRGREKPGRSGAQRSVMVRARPRGWKTGEDCFCLKIGLAIIIIKAKYINIYIKD